MKRKSKKRSFVNKAFQLFSDYFIRSDQKLKAWLLFTGIILSVIAIIALSALMPTLFMGFWAALTVVDLTGFLFYSGAIVVAYAAIVGINTIKEYLTGILSID